MKLDSSHVCIVQNGHYGDILDLLPVALHLHEQGKKVFWFCPEHCRDIFEAVSYVTPLDIPVKDLAFRDMIRIANEKFETVLIGGLWDFKAQGYPICQSYNIEHWRCAGYLEHFWNPEFRFELDRYRWGPPPMIVPRIVVNVTHGKSSPFPYGPTLLRKIQAAFPGHVLDIGPLRFPRFVYCLDIIQMAACLVAMDTGTLWLSQATPKVKVISIVNPNPWGGSVLRRPVQARMTYKEAYSEPGCVIGAIERCTGLKADPAWRAIVPPQPKGNWPDCFIRGRIDGESPIKLRNDAIKAWRECLSGSELPLRFHEVMTDIARRLGVETDDLIGFTGNRTKSLRPKLP